MALISSYTRCNGSVLSLNRVRDAQHSAAPYKNVLHMCNLPVLHSYHQYSILLYKNIFFCGKDVAHHTFEVASTFFNWMFQLSSASVSSPLYITPLLSSTCMKAVSGAKKPVIFSWVLERLVKSPSEIHKSIQQKIHTFQYFQHQT